MIFTTLKNPEKKKKTEIEYKLGSSRVKKKFTFLPRQLLQAKGYLNYKYLLLSDDSSIIAKRFQVILSFNEILSADYNLK